MRRHEEALIQGSVHIERGTALAADTGQSHAVGGALHQIGTAGHIAAAGSQTAAGVLDEGGGHQVSAAGHRLHLADKLAVAVVHQRHDVGVDRLDGLAQVTDLLRRQGFAHAVAAGTLDEHAGHGGILHRLQNGGQVGCAVLEGYFLVADAVVGKGAGDIATLADDGLQRVIHAAGDGHHGLTGPHTGKHGAGDGVGAVDERSAHQRSFTAKHPGIDALQLVPAHVVVAIAGGAGKVTGLYPLFGKGLQHFFGAYKGNAVDLFKAALAASFCPASQLGHLVIHM